MKIKNLFASSVLALVLFASCSKSDGGGGTTPTPTPVAAVTTLDVAYGADPLQKMDIYLPANRNTASTKILVLIHGGGWTQGDKADFNLTFIDTLKKRLPDYAIFNINYRLAALPSTNPFPAQENDVKAAVNFIYSNRTANLVSDKFVVMGASAGGHLALLHSYKYASPVKVKAVVDFFGPTDMVDLYNNPGAFPQLAIAALMSGTPTTNPTLYQQSSPIVQVTATSSPTIIIQGGLDPLVNATRQSQALATRLSSFLVPNQYVLYPAGGHGDWDAATYTDAFNKIQAFLGVHVQ